MAVLALFIPAVLAGAFAAGLMVGSNERPPAWWPSSISATERSNTRILYYRHPGGEPTYADGPQSAADGVAFVAVREGEDITFDTLTPAAPAGGASPAAETNERKILYYRNPMGLPDTSPVPKKDSMGMDYLPVYDGEADEGNIVKISPGKLQRTGVRSELVERRVVARPVRVPGTVQLDERRVALVATRSEAFVDHVENVTTGDRVRKGQPLLHIFSPEIAAAAAQVISNPGAEGSRRRLQNLNVSDETIAEIERTRKLPASIAWSSPQDGYVLERNAI
jgi:membrane fusion protein, copper/silver efflux system